MAVDPRKGDPAPAMEEWKEELLPKRADWMALLERLKARNVELYLKVIYPLLEGSTIVPYVCHASQVDYFQVVKFLVLSWHIF